MKEQIEQVAEFHSAMGLSLRDEPEYRMPREEKKMRGTLCLEEAQELVKAIEEDDLFEIADALGDLLYVVIGAAHVFGMAHRLKEIFDEVHRSNMTKLDENGKPIYRNDGKILKSKLFVPPDMKKALYKKKGE